MSSRHAPQHWKGAGHEDLLYRLSAYSRYVALVEEQEEALEEGDLEKHARLSEEREEIQLQLGEAPSREEMALAASDPEARALMEGALASLRAALSRDARMRATLAALKQETSGQIRTMHSRKDQVSSYLGGQELGGGDRTPRVNRKG